MLAQWESRKITSYVQGDIVEAGTFDVENIDLIAPAEVVSVTLPVQFQWRARLEQPQESYQVCFFRTLLPYTFGPTCSPSLGHAERYTLSTYSDYNHWCVVALDRTGGMGWAPCRFGYIKTQTILSSNTRISACSFARPIAVYRSRADWAAARASSGRWWVCSAVANARQAVASS